MHHKLLIGHRLKQHLCARPSTLKTQAFRCFHSSQATKMIRLLRPLRDPLGTPLMVPHHQPEKRILDPWGAKDRRSSFWKIMVQICRANTHEMRVCWIFSSAWSQSGHAGGWGSPRLAKRSAVQHRLLMANQKKIYTARVPSFSKYASKAQTWCFQRKRHCMQTCCCMFQKYLASIYADQELLAVKPGHQPIPK